MHLANVLLTLLPVSLLATESLAGSSSHSAHALPARRRHNKGRALSPIKASNSSSEHETNRIASAGASADDFSPVTGRRVSKRAQCGVSSPATSSKTSSTITVGAAVVPTAAATSSSKWKLDLEAKGNSFFDTFNFWAYDDPTHGTVTYVSQDEATKSNLATVNGKGNAVLAVDTTQNVQKGRKAVRLHSSYIFNGGLILADIVHMPTGCGTWPAWWSNGPDWPNKGEIDILEGTHSWDRNQVSVHTSDGCTIPSNYGASAVLTTGSFVNTNCASYATSNQGCGQRESASHQAYGEPFNQNGGGVYAMKWDTSGISVYFFPRNAIPADITQGVPLPETWGTPMGNFPSTSCEPFKFFKDHHTIINTTFCGDWANSDWWTAGSAGNGQSCAAKTGYNSCSDYVLNNGDKFHEAYWEFASVKYYQPK
ncbi:glycoside hydrolase family 16 protein [Phaffia rhodozyma]|uniref:Endo-1,3(4)-beta-glucanase n=1 Tax=Phaffia rhodozyma TaxID=264483 RepID=O60019_PHARH|nr:endo-1,3(4)-beta-glucanase [Phaffia rhodozyma]CED84840.1 glycoside hydrolase family 16 protein [Phaffia rhodozyma]